MASLQWLKKQMERGNVSKSDYNRQVKKVLNAPGPGKSSKSKPMLGPGSGCERNADGTFAHGNSCAGK